MRALAACIALELLGACATPSAAPPAYTDLSQAFMDFYDRTEGLDGAARVAAFRAEVAPLYPGFYSTRGRRTEAQQDQLILANLERFPEIRDRYVAVQRQFPAAYAGAVANFRLAFPGSTASLPTWLLHSLGEMDGGTREIDGQAVMIFGADGIASYHTPDSLGPFFDHELFHVEHGAHFKECDAVWCALWTEGLATAAAEQMNPGVSQEALMLTIPRPIAPEVDHRWAEALCYAQARLDSTEADDYQAMFFGNGGTETLPPRWGYYVGYRLAQRQLRARELADLARLDNGSAEPLIRQELAAMIGEAGGC